METLPYRQLEISLDAIRQNLATLEDCLPDGTRLMPMIKANGYGTDICQVADGMIEAGMDILGLAYVAEALQLREHGIQQDLFVCQPNRDEYPEAVAHQLHLAVMQAEQVDALNEECRRQDTVTPVHLKVNTGLNRFGCAPSEVLALARQIDAASHLRFDGLMTHFACADDPRQDPFTRCQIQSFENAITVLDEAGLCPPWRHAANSAGILRFDLPRCNMARPGIACLGVPPSVATFGAADLRLAIELSTRIVHINRCGPGDTVSYGRSYTCSKPSERIAAIPLGYADGIHWSYRNSGQVLIRDTYCPLVGNICMDSCLVDITEVPQAEVGDPVILINEELHPTLLAEEWKTIPYQIMVGLGARIKRKCIN